VKPILFVVLALLAGCASNPLPSDDIDADSLYRWGDGREELEQKYGKGTAIWVGDVIPDDAFAAATMREMISAGKPRPSFYEIFARRIPGPQGDYCRDYVFFNDQNRVLYSARRQPVGPKPK
jgi:hypothetical protein